MHMICSKQLCASNHIFRKYNPDARRSDYIINKRYIMNTSNSPESHWLICPHCKSRTRTKVYEDTVLIKFPLFCQKCKAEYRITVVKFKMVLDDKPWRQSEQVPLYRINCPSQTVNAWARNPVSRVAGSFWLCRLHCNRFFWTNSGNNRFTNRNKCFYFFLAAIGK